MRKILTSCLIFIIVVLFMSQVWAAKEDVFELQLTVKNNTENEKFDMFLLLSAEYIQYAIENDPTVSPYTDYEGSNTLREYVIKGIDIKQDNVQTEVYVEKDIEYVQIKLEKDSKGIYKTDILNDYGKMDMKFRIINEDKDYIMHIDNFKIDDGECKAIYDYDEDTIKQPDTRKVSWPTIILVIILIIVVSIGYMSYKKTR